MTRLARWVPLLAVVVLLGAAMLAANFANPNIDQLPDRLRPFPTQDPVPTATTTAPAPAPAATVSKPPPNVTMPAWIQAALTAACIALVLIVLGILTWLYLRDRARRYEAERAAADEPVPTPEETEAAVRAAVRAGLAALDDDGDPRRAVIACWVRLEAAAAAAGTPREPGDTSTDLVSRLLVHHRVSEQVLADFAEVYREARFASHAVDASSRDQARAALRQLGDELSGVGHGR